MKVKLKHGHKRWKYKDWKISRGEEKECDDHIFEMSGGRLEKVEKKSVKKTITKTDDTITISSEDTSEPKEKKEVKLIKKNPAM